MRIQWLKWLRSFSLLSVCFAFGIGCSSDQKEPSEAVSQQEEDNSEENLEDFGGNQQEDDGMGEDQEGQEDAEGFDEFEENEGQANEVNQEQAFNENQLGSENGVEQQGNELPIEAGFDETEGNSSGGSFSAGEGEWSGTGGLKFGHAGIAAAPGLPELGTKMPYMIQKGDTLGRISKSIYGTRARWKDLAMWSSVPNPDMIYPGDIIYYELNEQSLAFASSYETSQQTVVTVQPGDTLGKLAYKYYGNKKYWNMIWRQNSNLDNPDKLNVGEKIKLNLITKSHNTANNNLEEAKQEKTEAIDENQLVDFRALEIVWSA